MRNPIMNINTDVNFCGIRQRDIVKPQWAD